MLDRDTIAAIATPPGRGGIGVIRVSGSIAAAIGRRLIDALPTPRRAVFSVFRDEQGRPFDSGIVLYFPMPHSFTGEDVVELHGHGGPVVMNLLLKQCLLHGARLARPGEFTERAFLNGKLDLAQAEAVADLIDSCSEQAVRSAHRSLQGVFSDNIHAVVEKLIDLRCYVEAAIDFPEEEIDFLSEGRVAHDLNAIDKDIRSLLASARQGYLLRDGLHVVLAGRPNAGKSSLLNALARQDRAIVSTSPGTTRDTIEVQIQIDGMPVTLVDTAGLRTVQDEVEGEGVRRTRTALQNADHVLFVVDDCEPAAIIERDVATVPHTWVFNKIDLTERTVGKFEYEGCDALAISALDGVGLDDLREHLKRTAGYQEVDGSTFIARSRHLEAIRNAWRHVVAGRQQLVQHKAGELLAEELRLAQQNLAEVTGEFTNDQLLGRIFSSFCIGK